MSDELVFDERDHSYEADGIQYPSVTQILQDVGIIDTRWYKPGSAQVGASKHKILADYATKTLDWSTLTEDGLSLIETYQEFLNKEVEEILSVEKCRRHRELRFAGTSDLVYRDKTGKIVLVDIKTGAPERWHDLQIAAYMLLEKQYQHIDEGRKLYIKDGNYKLSKPIDYETSAGIFAHAFTVSEWKHARD